MTEVKPFHPLLCNRATGLSSVAARMLRKASLAISRRESNAAATALANVLALSPGHPEALRLLGMLHNVRGDHAGAVAALRQAMAAMPDDALILMNLGTTLHIQGDVDEAMSSLQRTCELAPDFAPAWYNFGKMLEKQGRFAGAITALHRAVDLDPEHVPARILLADVQTRLGALVPALANYRKALRDQPGQPDAWIGITRLNIGRLGADDVAQLQQALRAPQATDVARIKLGFALAHALEGQADPEAALRMFAQSNALKRRQVSWDAEAARAYTESIFDAFRRPLAGAQDTRLGGEVIFIVGLPRSGATLVEQILASHPQVDAMDGSAGLQQIIDEESARRRQSFPQWTRSATPADWQRMGEDYLARSGRRHGRRLRFTDSNPLNWRLVGAAMAMLPGAQVVNSRRDAVENCFSCYRQLFVTGNLFSYDLDDMVSYWRDYDRLSRHWQSLFPQHFFEQGYEGLLDDPQVQTWCLLDFCGLAFDPACLEFDRIPGALRTAGAEQLRQLPNRGLARAELYGDRLDRLRVLLGVERSRAGERDTG